MQRTGTTQNHSHHRQQLVSEDLSIQHMNDLEATKKFTLSHGYIPQPQDILCGKSKVSFNHVGNRRFRVTVSLFLKRYDATPSRTARGALIASVVDMIHNNGCRFLKKEKNHWVVLNKQEARSKVGHALRDASFHLRKVSTKQNPMEENSGQSSQEEDEDESIFQSAKREKTMCRPERMPPLSGLGKQLIGGNSDALLDMKRWSISQLDEVPSCSSDLSDDEEGPLGLVGQVQCL